eukprot:5408942-Heterocapsa_arctica.AAC.1
MLILNSHDLSWPSQQCISLLLKNGECMKQLTCYSQPGVASVLEDVGRMRHIDGKKTQKDPL